MQSELLLHAGQYDQVMARKFYSGISVLPREDMYILAVDDYSSHRDILALPFSQSERKVSKPLGIKYVEEPITLGHRIRNRRLELGLLQKDVAVFIGVTEDCVTLWENERSIPQVHHYPKIIDFLGYYPFSEDLNTLGNEIKRYRFIHGLSQNQLGRKIKVDGSTVCNWETGETMPRNQYLDRLQKYLNISVTI